MTKKTPEELALEAYLAGLTDKKASVSDNRLIAYSNPERNTKLSKSRSGKIMTEQTRAILSEANIGKSLSEETRLSISKGSKGKNKKPMSAEHKAKLSKANAGKSPTEETRLKLSSAMKGKSNLHSMKQCITPFGIFPSLKSAAEELNKIKSYNNGYTFLCRKMKENQPEYRYISQEEYIMLTGKEL